MDKSAFFTPWPLLIRGVEYLMVSTGLCAVSPIYDT